MRLFLLTVILLQACRPQSASLTNENPPTEEETPQTTEEVIEPTENADGSVTAVAKVSEVDQTLTSTSGPTAGTSVFFPAGSLAIDTEVVIGRGSDLTSFTEPDSNATNTALSKAVSILGNGEILRPLVISLVLGDSLALTQSRTVVVYRTRSKHGLIEAVTIRDGKATFETMVFGVFQVMTITPPPPEPKTPVVSNPTIDDAPKVDGYPEDFAVSLGGSLYLLETATCLHSDIVDPDGDAISKSYLFEVKKGSSYEVTVAASSYMISEYADTIRCSVTATDGKGWTRTFYSNESAILLPPRSVNLSAYSTSVGQSILCVQNLTSFEWEFSSDGTTWASAGTTNPISITPSHSRGLLRCKATDTVGNMLSPVATVLNTPPENFLSSLSSVTPAVGDSIGCLGTTTDQDLDGLTYTYNWRAGDNASVQGTAVGSSSSLTISSSLAHKYIKCQVIANDGYSQTAGAFSQPVLIVNTPPSFSVGASVSPTVGVPLFVGSTAECNHTASDADNDILAYFYVWKSDGVVMSGRTTKTTVIPASEAHKNITCVVTASDVFTSTSSTSSDTAVDNTFPTVGSFGCGSTVYVNRGATLASIGSCSWGFTDVDGDTPVVGVTGTCPSATVSYASSSVSFGSNQITEDCAMAVTVNDGHGSTNVTANVSVAVRLFHSAALGTPTLGSSCEVSIPLTIEAKDGANTRTGETFSFTGSLTSPLVSWTNATGGQTSLVGTATASIDAVNSLGARIFSYSVTSNHGVVSATKNVTVGAEFRLKKPESPGVGGDGIQADFATDVCSGSCSGSKASVSVSDKHACVVGNDGRVKCWGTSNNLSLGGASNDADSTVYGPRTVLDTSLNPVTGAVMVATASGSTVSEHSCYLNGTGEVYCWGKANKFQTGSGDNQSHLSKKVCESGQSAPCSVFLSGVQSISLSDASGCSVLGGGVYCWGAGTTNQLGNGYTDDVEIATLVKIDASTALSSIVSVASGESFYCGLTSGGEVFCWGNNTFGQLGTSPSGSGYAATVTGISGVVQIAAGGSTACALTSSGVYCWGKGTSGQLGNGASVNSSTAVLVSNSSNAVSISVGDEHACFIDTVGEAYCFGNNSDGRLGVGNTTNRNIPVKVVGIGQTVGGSALTGVMAVGAGSKNTCFLGVSGDVFCAGNGASGVLGSSFMGGFNSSPVVTDTANAARSTCPQYRIQ